MEKKSRDNLTGSLKAVTKIKFHEQIVEQVQALIEKGGLKHGDQLPAERELASIFKVSRHSVREAIRVLEQKRVLKSRPGS